MHIFCTEKDRQERKWVSNNIIMESLYYVGSKAKIKIPLLNFKFTFNKKRMK